MNNIELDCFGQAEFTLLHVNGIAVNKIELDYLLAKGFIIFNISTFADQKGMIEKKVYILEGRNDN